MEPILLTSNDLADLYNVSLKTITEWVKEGLPVAEESPRKFDLKAAIHWLMERSKKAKPSDQLLEQKIRLTAHQANLREIEVLAAQKLLLPAAHITRVMGDIVVELKTSLTAIPSKVALPLAGMSEPADIEVYLKQLIDEALNQTCNGITAIDPHCANSSISPHDFQGT